MKKFSTVVEQMLLQEHISYFFLVYLKLSNGATEENIYSTSAPIDITMSDTKLYLSSNVVVVEPPRLSNSIDRASYRVTFLDPTFIYRGYLETKFVGRPLEARVGFFNTTDEPILDAGGTLVQPGFPFTNLQDTILAYKGVTDTAVYSIDPEEGKVLVSFEASSPMANLDLVKPFYTTKDTLASYNINDTCFDKVFEGSGQLKLKWGKK